METAKEYLKALLQKWDKYDELDGVTAISFKSDIELLLEFWDERIKPLERIPEETKKRRKLMAEMQDSYPISVDEQVEPLQNGEREEDKLRAKIKSEVKWELEEGGDFGIDFNADHITDAVMPIIKDLLSQSKKECEEKEKAETKKKIEELFHFYIPHGLYTESESSWMYTQFGEAIVNEFLRDKDKLV